MEIIKFIDREEKIRWSLSFINDFCLTFLWQPEYKPLSTPAYYAFLKDIN